MELKAEVPACNSRVWEVEARAAKDGGEPRLHEILCPNKEGRGKGGEKKELEEILGLL